MGFRRGASVCVLPDVLYERHKVLKAEEQRRDEEEAHRLDAARIAREKRTALAVRSGTARTREYLAHASADVWNDDVLARRDD